MQYTINMKKTARVLLGIIILGFAIPILQKPLFAGDLTNTYLRLDRQAISTSTGGLVCATTPSSDNGAEDSLQVIFPSGFSVNQTASNWTVSTSDLPSGATAWPGISTADSISGQIVTFPSSNLTSSTQYCFYFSASNTLTTPSSTGNFPGTIRTRNSGTTIDTIDIGLSIVSSDRITVTATVPANPTDFEADLVLADPTNGTFPQNTQLTYTLTYGSLLSTTTSITVEAEWNLGTIQGSPTATEDILDYVVGSATSGYGGSTPVIDSLNRKITWSITSIPGGTTNQTVSFKLKTNNSYLTYTPVSLSVSGRVLGPGTQTSDSTVTSSYLNTTSLTPTPNPTCAPAVCPTSTPGPTSTPSPTPSKNTKPLINTIDIRSINSSSSAIFISSDTNVKAFVNYGTTTGNLNLKASNNNAQKNHLITLSNLKPKTRYYFQVTVENLDGKRRVSDLFVFDTSALSIAPRIPRTSIIITSLDIQLSNSIPLEGVFPNIIIPTDTAFSFRFTSDDYENIKSITAILRNKKVLGITNTNDVSSDTTKLTVTEISPGQYVGKFNGHPLPGAYNLLLRIQDYNGNLTEEDIASIYITRPMQIINKITKQGVENVKTTFYYYNSRLKIYQLISDNITSIKNPIFSGYNGTLTTVLPEGKYRALIEGLGYQEKTVDFEIKPGLDAYPIIEIDPLPFNIITQLKYYFEALTDLSNGLNDYFNSIKYSNRYFELFSFLTFILLTFILFLTISHKIAVPIHKVPQFMLYHLISLIHRPKHTFLVHGRVIDDLGQPVSGILLHLTSKGGKILAHTKTNSSGEFMTYIHSATDLVMTGSSKGYSGLRQTVSMQDLDDLIQIQISHLIKPSRINAQKIRWYLHYTFHSLFEIVLVFTFVVEIFFTIEFGIIRVLPFLALSLLSIILWAGITYPSSRIKEKN